MKNTVNFQKFKADQNDLDKDFNRFAKITHKFFRLEENCTANFYKQIYYLMKVFEATITIINCKKIIFKNGGRESFAVWLRDMADRIETGIFYGQ